jgi:glycosyltransferase involved in cell wall biosynthesis
VSEEERQPPLGAGWRAEAESAQEAVLPSGRVVVTCAASQGIAGLGRHLQEITDALDRAEQPSVCISAATRAASPGSPYRALGVPGLASVLGPLTHFSPVWKRWKGRVEFDAYAAARLPAADHLIAFTGQSLAQFYAARQKRYMSVSLMSGGAHARRVARQQDAARRQYPLERPAATRIFKRYLSEYALADRIYVTSRYSWESFVEEGLSQDRLSLFPLTPDPRFQPEPVRRVSNTFDIVYVGGLSVAKGVPLLIDAVSRVPYADVRLVLVGGWGTRSMRRFIEKACAADPRISAGPGDPLPRLRAARVCVHPSYVDGFSYGAAEALAAGVPVIASEDTGMKDLIDPGRNGLIVPTGHLGALTEAIELVYRGEIFSR